MSLKPFVVQPEDRAEALNVVAGDKIWVLASKEVTRERSCTFLQARSMN